MFSSGNFKNTLGTVVIKSDVSSANSSSGAPILESNLGAGNTSSLNVPKTNHRRYSLMVFMNYVSDIDKRDIIRLN